MPTPKHQTPPNLYASTPEVNAHPLQRSGPLQPWCVRVPAYRGEDDCLAQVVVLANDAADALEQALRHAQQIRVRWSTDPTFEPRRDLYVERIPMHRTVLAHTRWERGADE